ncbi:MAG TPA: flagella basal body P-ring formation protein FlgA, partial [Plasticicumulans sp.]|nr:flagella basal body P-ring formation protein FlgA [Plasticicumulans sp.]
VSVRRGETLELVVRRGAMRISAGGVALADGRPGERMRARNLASGRVVEGRLEQERTLIVD